MNRHDFYLIRLLLFSTTLTVSMHAAEIEDLQNSLKGVTENFRKSAEADERIRNYHKQLLEADDKQKAFQKYKNEIANQIVRQDQLVQKINGALKVARGIAPGRPADLTSLLTSFEGQMSAHQAELKDLQAQAKLLSKKDGLAGKMGTLQLKNLQMIQKQIELVRTRRQFIVRKTGGQADIKQIVEILEAMKLATAIRETSLGFKFAYTAHSAKIQNFQAQLKAIFDQLMGGKDFASHFRQIGITVVDDATHLTEMALTLFNEDLVLPDITDEGLEAVMTELDEMEDLFPYEVNDIYYLFDTRKDRWFISGAKGQRVYLPIDEELWTGKYVRMHTNGFLYSDAPFYDEPKQLTWTKDWEKEVQEKAETPKAADDQDGKDDTHTGGKTTAKE